ncbi:MAG: hypothetical protein Q8L56_07320 [Rhodocyclaceae bacterium]|nr:hypothetical protein [Rhodocyclaceae bacterium]
MSPDLLVRNIRLLGFIALAICIATWWMDFAGWVYICPYCRIQRSVIGLLGLLMVLPHPHHWLSRYIGSVFAVLGLVTAAMHFFSSLKEVFEGEFVWDTPWYLDSFLLSGCALLIITGQILLLYQSPADRAASC